MENDYCGFMVRYIYISGEGITNHYLGMGISDVSKLYKLAENGKIENAESIKIECCYNCDIVFKGANLLEFIQKHFPEYLENNTIDINSDETYKVSAIDLS